MQDKAATYRDYDGQQITFITAFYNIGRETWDADYKRSVNTYIAAAKNYIRLGFKMVIFMDDRYLDFITDFSEEEMRGHIIIPIHRMWLEEHSYVWRQLAVDQKIMSSDVYKEYVQHRICEGYPENKVPMYNVITNAKIDFIMYAITHGYVKDSVACWTDFGYFNSVLHNNPAEYPQNTPDIRKFPKDKLCFTVLNEIREEDSDMVYTLKEAPHVLATSFFGGSTNLYPIFQRCVHEALDEMHANGISDDDQHVYLRAILKMKEQCHMLISRDTWPNALAFFESEGMRKDGEEGEKNKNDFTNKRNQRRIAMYFSGRIKTYEDQLVYLKQLQEHFEMDCFCSINGQLDEQHEQFLRDMNIKGYFFQNHDEIYDKSWQEKFKRLPTQSDRDAWKLSSSWFNNMKCMELIEEYQKQHGFNYDIVVKFRVDVLSTSMLPILEDIKPNTIYIPEGHDWHFLDLFQGINEGLAYGQLDVMRIYSNAFAHVDQYCMAEGRGYHPESLLLHHLKTNGLDIFRFPFEYTFHANRHEYREYG